MQPRAPDLDFVQLGGRGLETMGHIAVGIDAGVCVALLRRRHLGDARPGLGFGRARRIMILRRLTRLDGVRLFTPTAVPERT